MSFWCNNSCKLPDNTIGAGICRCCPTAEYYRRQYQLDERGRAFVRSINIPLPINLFNLNCHAAGFYFSTFDTVVASGAVVPFNAATYQNFLNTDLNGTVTLTLPGVYQINYTVSTLGGGSVYLDLDQTQVPGSLITGPDTFSGSVIVNSTTHPAHIRLINAGPGNIHIIPTTVNGVSAQMTITQL